MIAWREIKFHAAGVDLLTPARRPEPGLAVQQRHPAHVRTYATAEALLAQCAQQQLQRAPQLARRVSFRHGDPLADRVVLEAVSSALNLNLGDQQAVVQ